MKKVMMQINGEDSLPSFKHNVLYHSEFVSNLRELHMKISQEDHEFKKEELFFYLLEELIQTYSDLAIVPQAFEASDEIKTVCAYLEENYTKTIKLSDLSALTGWSKYHLLRSFTKQMGISPYSFLETIRVNHAKKMLEQGNKPIEVAFLTGFSDQSHLTKYFKSLVGLTPKQYMRIFENEEGA